MPAPPPAAAAGLIQVTPEQLDTLAEQTVAVGLRVEELAASAGAVLRDLAAAMPGSATAVMAAQTGVGCAELLRAEGTALRTLGGAFSAAARAYREGDATIAGRLLAVAP